MTLFRKEVFEHKHQRLYGAVVLPTNVPYALLSGLIALLLVLIIGAAVFGQYSRSERAIGHLMPSMGLVKIQPLKSGTLTELYVAQGEKVAKGARLASLQSAAVTTSGLSVQQSGIDLLTRQIDLLAEKHRLANRQVDIDLETIAADRAALTAEKQSLTTKMDLQSQVVASADRTFEASTLLRQDGHISSVEFERRQQFLLQAQQTLATQRQDIATIENRIDGLALSQAARQLDHEKAVRELEAEKLALRQRIAELEGDQQFNVQAPVSGTVASILTTVGRGVERMEPIITLLPEGGDLHAELFVPSRAIGFIKVGQPVKLSYDAFPYQQYGRFDAQITSITKTMLLPEETRTGFAVSEPVYRVKATIRQDHIDVDGDTLPLQPGMRVDATIILERRSLLAWFWQSLIGLEGLA